VSFGHPEVLIALVAVPLAALGYWLLEERRRRRAAAWTRSALLPNIVRRPSRRVRILPVALFLLGLAFLLVGFARPQQVLASSSGGAPTVVLAVDISSSMGATDVQPTRLRAARDVAVKLLRELPANYPVAVVAFGSKPILIVPPTTDRRQVIDGIPTGPAALSGTAIGDGISSALGVIGAAEAQRSPGTLYHPGAVVVLSDGGQNAGGTTPTQAAVAALVNYVPIDSIVVGTGKGTVTQRLKVGFVRQLRKVPVPVQPGALRMISHQTQGSFFLASAVENDPSRLDVIAKTLQRHTVATKRTRELAGDAALLALVAILAGATASGLLLGRVA
jgi:Ca-activated chloride channel family protein